MNDEHNRNAIDERYEITITEASERHTQGEDGVDRKSFVLIDIREADELAIASIEGAVWIPMGDLGTRINEIDIDEEGTIGLICHSGRRSLSAAVALQQAGLDEVRSVAGGIEAWSLQIDPTVPRY